MSKYNFVPELAAKKTSKKEDNNFIMIILGSTGSGKSYSALMIGLLIKIYATIKYKEEHEEDPVFDIDTICFKAQKVMKALDEGLPPQSVIMIDEGGEVADARKWWSDPNDVITSTIDTFRADRLCLIWATPDMQRIDKRVREEADLVAQMLGKRKMKVQSVKKDRVTNTVLNPYPKLKDKVLKGSTQDGDYANVKVGDLNKLLKEIGKEEMLDEYEEKKRRFINEVQSEGRERLEQEDNGRRMSMIDIVKIAMNDMNDINFKETSQRALTSIFRGRLSNEYPDRNVNKQDIEDAVNIIKKDRDYAEKIAKT